MDSGRENQRVDAWMLDRTSECCLSVVHTLDLDLHGRIVLTECATGAYSCTAVLAALAGADVFAYGRDGRYGTAALARSQTLAIATRLGVASRISFPDSVGPGILGAADIVTNSGHLRPLDRAKVSLMKAHAVIALMYEAWEFRRTDLDIDACRQFDVEVVATNEHHPKLRIFDYLGLLAMHGLFQCGIPVIFSRILLLSDNLFSRPIAGMLRAAGAEVTTLPTASANAGKRPDRTHGDQAETKYDAVVVAMTPRNDVIIGTDGRSAYSPADLGNAKCLIQVWGDVDRTALQKTIFYPPHTPPKGHMGILLNEIGPDAVVRLQGGGLRAAQERLSREDAASGPRYSEPLGC